MPPRSGIPDETDAPEYIKVKYLTTAAGGWEAYSISVPIRKLIAQMCATSSFSDHKSTDSKDGSSGKLEAYKNGGNPLIKLKSSGGITASMGSPIQRARPLGPVYWAEEEGEFKPRGSLEKVSYHYPCE
ncbi:unnamed protein product [Sphenostylis stenocarpa]|uniref:Uncharacterized protein n=1 Tax=Sphenostylis stenocarpa TaxID=92480 RepID=A0AA86W0H1_9FABA|nr:unnamed protein product [Sphenostylis stenocarpa]